MPATRVVFYRELDGSVPVLDWLKGVARRDPRAYAKCLVRIRRLEQLGHELRRPEADYVRDDIWELRIRWGTVNYRILYFYSGGTVCVLSHAMTKREKLLERDIERAAARKTLYEAAPEAHHHEQRIPDHG